MTTPKTWDPACEPTADQLAEWLKVCTDEERIRVAQSALSAMRASDECFVQRHEGRIYDLEREVHKLREGWRTGRGVH